MNRSSSKIRTAVRSALIGLAGAAVAAVPLATIGAAQEAVRFTATDPYSSERVTLNAELFRPEGPGPYPAVVLMHGCGGWQAAVHHALRDHARYLVRSDFVVLNLDSFGPRNSGGGKLCASDRELRQAIAYRTHDAFDALQYLQVQRFVDADNIFLMGQSNGGSVAINAAKNTGRTSRADRPSFRAVVAYYPWCGVLGRTDVPLASPLLIFGGEKDDWVPPRDCKRATGIGADLRVMTYPEAAHSFDLGIAVQRYLGKLIGADPHATRDSREKMLAFFFEHMTGDLKHKLVAAVQTTAQAAYVPQETLRGELIQQASFNSPAF